MLSRVVLRIVLRLMVVLAAASGFAATGDRILHDFQFDDGLAPHSALTLDASGNLYGTTFDAGPNGKGTLFELSANPDGTRSFSLLHSFPAFDNDGLNPSSGISFDAAGNLYGSTASGGVYGQGSVYELSPVASGWQYKLLHSFSRHNGDGVMSYTTPVVDGLGNVYGATLGGGASDEGVVFQLVPQPDGSFKENVIHNLPESPGPQGRMDIVIGADGTLYVSRSTGGPNGSGSVFQLSSSDGKTWTRATLHNFGLRGSGDPAYPSGIALDASGNIFGVSTYGGAADMGCLFELPRRDDGTFGQPIRIHSFRGGADGTLPGGAPAFDDLGNIYGTTSFGGTFGKGIVYKFVPIGQGGFTGFILHNFQGQPDGERPVAGPTPDPSGNVYGTTQVGGASQGGTVWKLAQ